MQNMLNQEQLIKDTFKNDDTFLSSTIFYKNTDVILCKIFYLDGITDIEKVVNTVIKPIKEFASVKKYIFNPKVKKYTDLKDAVKDCLTGALIMLIPDGNDLFYTIDVKKVFVRSIDEPSSEKVTKGPKDGFIENIISNISLIRTHIKSSSLKINFKELKNDDKGKLAIIYLDNKVDKKVLKLLNERIDNAIDTYGIDINILKEKIRDKPYSPFKTIGDTQRPDTACFKLLEGKIILMIDGSPIAIYLPFFLSENFESPGDYYTNYVFASFSKIIRFISFLFSILIPGLYVAFMMYHQELIPTRLLISIASSRLGVPFPTVIECFILLTMFEMLKEAGAKVSSLFGSALSIVGALIIGQATVDARIVSTSVVIVVAVSSVTALVTPKLNGASIIIRYLLLLLASIMGVYGIIIGIVFVIAHLTSISSFEKEYVSKLFTFNIKEYEKTYLRLPEVKK